MKILVDHRTIRGVPAIELYNPEAAVRLPVIILMHGFTGRKEHLLAHAYELAGAGFNTVSIDLHLHGELGEVPFIPARVTPQLNEVLDQSAGFIDRLVDEYGQSATADGSRIGLMGYSLGGAVIYRYLPFRQPVIKTAVAMVAGADPFWHKTVRYIMQVYPEFGVTEQLIAENEQVTSRQPFLQGVTDFPLLMQYGVDDPIVRIEDVRLMYRQVKEQYHQKDLLRLIEYEHTGHETPHEMIIQAQRWMQTYL
jgi:predicted esterase